MADASTLSQAPTGVADATSPEPASARRPVAPYIPATRAHHSDAFTGYSEPTPPELLKNPSQLVAIRGLYSSTQFDTLSVLSHVYTRPNPKIELGPVDDSVSFVVVDSTKPDYPIVYCSKNFLQLTGYAPEEIVGRNCRFLQYPPQDTPKGQEISGTRLQRSPAVEAFKKSLTLGQECQASLVNYKRDGEPFLNLISVVPIQWKDEDGRERAYHVGFQVDLSEALNSSSAENDSIPDPAESVPQALLNTEPRGPGDESWAET